MSVLKILCIVTLIACVASGSESGFCEAPECTVDSGRCLAQNRFTRKRSEINWDPMSEKIKIYFIKL